MGTFGGHALPGSFLLIFGVWWTVQICRRYYKSLAKLGPAYRSTATYPSSCLCGRLRNYELEGALKIVFTTVGFALEIYTGFKDGKFVYLGNGQHATMFFFFGLSGVMDLLVHYRVPLPTGISYVGMAMALVVEGLLFKFHVEGRDALERVLHQLLVYSVFAGVLAIAVEMAQPRLVLAALGRAFCVLLQGTWFWQVGFILYNPLPGATTWNPDSADNLLVAVMMYAWHVGAVFLVMLVIAAVTGCVYRNRGDFNNDYDSLSMNLLQPPQLGNHGDTVVALQGDSESDIEFEKPTTRT